MLAVLSRTSPSREEVAAQIADSVTVSSDLIQTENLVIAHHIATGVGEYWDIVYATRITDAEIDELVSLADRIFQRFGAHFERMVVAWEEIPQPHPWFPDCDSYTYARICPRMAI
ncbi:hypothetical protein ABZW10_28245 [Kitasatospora sp. NPDC004723]|uniref:hypothetical protein n=1 Tax=Kitasatospora sp. NPDC004723 TaxID=3154288 RepID=UPI0033A69F1A